MLKLDLRKYLTREKPITLFKITIKVSKVQKALAYFSRRNRLARRIKKYQNTNNVTQ